MYSGNSPADGIFTDNNRIGCGEAGLPSNVSFSASSSACPATPNTLFVNPAYPTGPTPFLRFGNLGRNVFQGPMFLQMDMSLTKVFKITERVDLKFSAQAQNLTNHPSFDCIDSNLNSSTFGEAQCLAQSGGTGQSTTGVFSGGIGLPVARIMSIGLRAGFLAFSLGRAGSRTHDSVCKKGEDPIPFSSVAHPLYAVVWTVCCLRKGRIGTGVPWSKRTSITAKGRRRGLVETAGSKLDNGPNLVPIQTFEPIIMASMLAPASKFSKMTETGMRVPRSCAYQKPDSRPSAKYSRRSLWPRLERCRTRS